MKPIVHFVLNCGNFSKKALGGIIGYGREKQQGRGKLNASEESFFSDGYATKEGDILVGGFLRIQAPQRARIGGKSFTSLSVAEQESLTLELSREHLQKFGTASHENYEHWLLRARLFARSHSIELPNQFHKERDYAYFRRLRKWVAGRKESWPTLDPAAGTHLVFSPEPRMWDILRAQGADERIILRQIIHATMKEFGDWRRELNGPGHSLGWVAGTHVVANGADRHPHIHLVVLKRDQAGKEVDWSVTSLKGMSPGKPDNDPLSEIKRLFSKHVEKEFQKYTSKTLESHLNPDIKASQEKSVEDVLRAIRSGPKGEQSLNTLSHFSMKIRAAAKLLQRAQPRNLPRGRNFTQYGHLLRFISLVYRATKIPQTELANPSEIREQIRAFMSQLNFTTRAFSQEP
jgi:hypothetical protein